MLYALAGVMIGVTFTLAVLAILRWRARRADYRRQMAARLEQVTG
jgi:hypothetical protein